MYLPYLIHLITEGRLRHARGPAHFHQVRYIDFTSQFSDPRYRNQNALTTIPEIRLNLSTPLSTNSSPEIDHVYFPIRKCD